jgi:glycosyltransferase involved in cell wall biosynthesis
MVGEKIRLKKGILLVAFYFAPSSEVGGKRPSFLSHGLLENYPNIHVLTVKERYSIHKDESLRSGGIIHRTVMLIPPGKGKRAGFSKPFYYLWSRFFCLIEIQSGWLLPALIRGKKVIKKNEVGVIVATGPPFTSHLVGFLLSIITKTKLILDYRDPWTTYWRVTPRKILYRINKFLEPIVVRRSSAVVFCSETMRKSFSRVFRAKGKKGLFVVNNGYSNDGTGPAVYLSNGKVTMIYAGALYGERRVRLLAEPLLELANEKCIDNKRFAFHIFGNLSERDKMDIEQRGLNDIIAVHPVVSHYELVRYLRGADILVLIVSRNMSYSISYKFYDYLSVRKPVLAIVPENSEMERVMKDIDCGEVAFLDNPESILKKLRVMIAGKRKYAFRGVERYTWQESARKYSEIINRVLS